MDDGAAAQVEHQREVAVALADGHLIDGDLLELLELGLGEPPLQIAFLDVLDNVPTDIEMPGRVLDGGELRELQRVAFKGVRVAPARIGEGNLDLPGEFTSKAHDPRHLDHEERRLQTDGDRPQEPLLVSLSIDCRRAARRAAILLPGLLDPETDAAQDEIGPVQLVATNAAGMVQ